ncbi:AAA family ATPase [Nocardia farcinica]|uniref:AAA family ATPase n=1 Tax=Nocardia farcinica TaxID=37329 RepID=UPI001894141A|nr:AAA family ATPase [Nocardia farcinica]MBF6189510.1 AAA family ATPase [Nocardia farcinica]MBF6363188.1 AAA family ATPase [Nocardia farcinica]
MSEEGYDLTAERALLGTAMSAPDQIRDVFLAVQPDDWYHHTTRELAGVITGMMRAGRPIDANTTMVEAQNRGLVPGRIPLDFALRCYEAAALPESAAVHAQRIRELSAARKLSQIGLRIAQRMESAWSTGIDRMDVTAAIKQARQALDEAEQITADVVAEPPTPMGEFLSIPDTHDWLVPQLLERMDRVVLTGAEGGGKSVLCSQIACTLAAGLHPFSGNPLGSGTHRTRVLIIDCENSPTQSRRRYRWVTSMVDQRRHNHGLSPIDWNDMMSIEVRPAGIDLLTGPDSAWLEGAIASFAPDLLVLGPLYKLHHENPNDEKPAREIAWILDGLRERHGFALLTEAHAGKASAGDGRRNMAPIGSSVWLRWPEFGFGLRRSDDDTSAGRAQKVDVVSWRGSREERQWPSRLQFSHILPWVAADPAYYDELQETA